MNISSKLTKYLRKLKIQLMFVGLVVYTILNEDNLKIKIKLKNVY